MIALSTIDDAIDTKALKQVYGCFPSGVAALCGMGDDGRPVGIAVSSFTTVSMDPPLVSVCINESSGTGRQLTDRPVGLSVLSSDQAALCRRLAGNPVGRFDAVNWTRTPTGAVLIEGAAGWMEGTGHARIPAGDHIIHVLRVVGAAVNHGVDPLVFHASAFSTLAPALSESA